MKPWLPAVAALLWLCAPSYAAQPDTWDLAAMNKQIDQTSVKIGAGGTDFCSGTVIDVAKRLVLTADHCVAEQVVREEKDFVDPDTGEVTKKTIEKKLPLEVAINITKDYEVVGSHRYLAEIKGRDHQGDVALLQVVDESWVPPGAAKLAPDSYELQRGQKVWVVGNPAIEFDNSVSEGIVSATQRILEFPDVKMRVFQTDATAIGGNSGGSVLNSKGEMIGTMSAILREGSISFAVPISVTKTMLRAAGFGDVAGRAASPIKARPALGEAPLSDALVSKSEGWGGGNGTHLKFRRLTGTFRSFITPDDSATAFLLGLF